MKKLIERIRVVIKDINQMETNMVLCSEEDFLYYKGLKEDMMYELMDLVNKLLEVIDEDKQ